MDEGQELFRDVVEDVNSWIPPEDGKNFEESLYSFLSERVNIGSDGISKKEEEVKVEKASKISIRVSDSIGVKVIEDFSEKDLEEASDLIEEFDADFIVFTACGVKDIEAWKKFTVKHRGTSDPSAQVDTVWKEKQFFGKHKY